MSRDTLIEEKQGHVRLVRFNRPKAKNAFDEAMYNSLADALDEAIEDAGTRVIVLTGEGDAYSAGQDLNQMTSTTPNGGPIGFERMLDALVRCDKPIVTAVNGVALGIGMTMLAHTDVNYISTKARFKCPFTSLGVTPEAASSSLFPRIMGLQKANELLLTARWMSAEEAVASGLGFALVEPERLLETALEKAKEIAALPPRAVQATKSLVRAESRALVAETRERENASLAARIGSKENLEALAAFFEKRAPNFDGL